MPTCLLCPFLGDFLRVEDLEAHITGDHFDCTPYQCEKCQFAKFPTEYAIRNHYEQDHGLTEYFVRYHISPDIMNKREQAKRAVHMSLRGTASGRLTNEFPLTEITAVTDEEPSCFTDSSNKWLASIVNSAPGTSQIQEGQRVNEEESDITASDMLLHDNDDIYEPLKMADTITKLIMETQREQLSCSDTTTSSTPETYIQKRGTRPALTVPKIACKQCKIMVANRCNSYLYHVNVRHLHYPLFRCIACNKSFSSIAKIDILKHVKNAHNGDESLVEDNQKKYLPLIRSACPDYFQYRPQVGKRKRYTDRFTGKNEHRLK
jgi:hypothetical protein